jgi:PleD family two-component response regulator
MVIPKVLLADDDEAVREMLQVALERDGFEVVAVAGVKDARSVASLKKPLTFCSPTYTCRVRAMVSRWSAPCAALTRKQ